MSNYPDMPPMRYLIIIIYIMELMGYKDSFTVKNWSLIFQVAFMIWNNRDQMVLSYEAAMGLAEDDRPFPQEARLSSLELKDDDSMSSEEVSLSKENKEDDFSDKQEFLNSVNLVQDSTEHIETFAGNSQGFPALNIMKIL